MIKKNIAISEPNYLALKKLGCVGDSFDDVVSEILHKVRHNNIKTTAIEHGDGIATSSHELDGESEHD